MSSRPFPAHPADWRIVETCGAGPFVSRAVYEDATGHRHEWTSRRHRTGRGLQPVPVERALDGPSDAPGGALAPAFKGRHHGAALGVWIGVLFMIGSACFAVASLPGIASRADPTAVGITFVVGAAFFTSAAALQHIQTLRAERTVDRAAAAPPRPARSYVVEPHRLDWWVTAVQFIGTLFFNITTAAALNDALDTQEQIRRVWAPDAFGSVCFLIASYLAVVEVCHRRWCRRRDDTGWRIATLNLLGSVFFGLSAITSFILPGTGEVVDAEATNAFTFLGAACFFAGAWLVVVEALSARRTA